MSPALLAQVALDTGNPTVFLGLLMGGLLTLLTGVNQIDGMIARRKRTPPIESEFVTKAELKERLEGIVGEVGKIRESVDKLTRGVNEDFNTLYRALGKLEGVSLERSNYDER